MKHLDEQQRDALGDLQATEDSLKTMLEAINDAVLILDEHYDIIMANALAERLYGYPAAELCEKNFRELRAPETKAGLEAQMRQSLRDGGARWDTLHQRRDGSTFPVAVSSKPFKAGDRLRFVHIVRDLTERKRAEEALRDTALLPAQNPAPVLRIGRNGTVLYANPAATTLLQDWPLGLNATAPPAIARAVADAFDAKRVQERDQTVNSRDYAITIVPIPEAHYANLYWRDVTDRKQAEENLREQEARYRTDLEAEVKMRTSELMQITLELRKEIVERKKAEQEIRWRAELLDQTFSALIVWEFGGRIKYWNASAERLYGWTKDEAAGQKVQELLQTRHLVPFATVKATLRKSGFWEGEMRHTTRDGRVLVIESKQMLTSQPDGTYLVMETNRDITERKLTEEALQHREGALSRSQEELRTLTAQLMTAQEDERRRISRDLHDDTNQRLAMLTMEIETLMQQVPPSSDSAKPLQSIHRAVGELSDHLAQMAYQLHPSILDDLGLTIAVQRYAEDFAKRAGIACDAVVRALPDPFPASLASGLYRLLQECLGNILKHACANKVIIRLSGVGAYVQMSVHDNGIGMDRQVFAQQAEGFGFVSMRERVRLLSGQFSVQSQPGQGTVVTVLVPLRSEGAIASPRKLLADDRTLILEDTGQD